MNAPVSIAEEVVLRVGEATITVPGELAAMAYLEKLLDERRPLPPIAAFDAVQPPRIGDAWHGGIYAGLTVHENQPMGLVLLPGDVDDVGWEKAKAWAAEQGGELPSRIDQLVLRQNLKGEFKESYYWSGEQFAGDSDCAWGQVFGSGDQYDWHKGNECRARAVRRLPIQ